MAIQHSFPLGAQRRRVGLAGWLARLVSLRARLQRAAPGRAAAARRRDQHAPHQRVREGGGW